MLHPDGTGQNKNFGRKDCARKFKYATAKQFNLYPPGGQRHKMYSMFNIPAFHCCQAAEMDEQKVCKTAGMQYRNICEKRMDVHVARCIKNQTEKIKFSTQADVGFP
jgi:hypothetical protein